MFSSHIMEQMTSNQNMNKEPNVCVGANLPNEWHESICVLHFTHTHTFSLLYINKCMAHVEFYKICLCYVFAFKNNECDAMWKDSSNKQFCNPYPARHDTIGRKHLNASH